MIHFMIVLLLLLQQKYYFEIAVDPMTIFQLMQNCLALYSTWPGDKKYLKLVSPSFLKIIIL